MNKGLKYFISFLF